MVNDRINNPASWSCYPGANSDCCANAYTCTCGNAYSGANAYANTHANDYTHANTGGHRDPDANSNANVNTNAYPDPDTNACFTWGGTDHHTCRDKYVPKWNSRVWTGELCDDAFVGTR